MEEPVINGFDFTLINEYFVGLDRQGPGSHEATMRALSFVGPLSEESKIADLGCGTGWQTMTLAQHTQGVITALDLFPGSIDKLNAAAKRLGLQNRVKGVVGSMDDLPFQSEEFDLIWSEGAIAIMGFANGLRYWKKFLKTGGHIAVTYESWFTPERPAEIETFWVSAVPEIACIAENVAIMQNAGFLPVAVFVLPERCWTETYFLPQRARQEAFLQEHAGNTTAAEFVASMRREAELYAKYKQYYGYVFYIGRKL